MTTICTDTQTLTTTRHGVVFHAVRSHVRGTYV